MSQRPVFTLPAQGLALTLTDDTIGIRYEGDLVLEQSLDRTLTRVWADGDLTIRGPKVAGTVGCGGTLRILGDFEADRLEAPAIEIGAHVIKARAIVGHERVQIGAAKLAVDVLMGPQIALDPAVTGRVTVLESGTEVGTTKLKGVFSIADYDDTFGNAEAFLSDRGVTRPTTGHRTGPTAAPRTTTPPADVPTVIAAPPALAPIDDVEPLPEEAFDETLTPKLDEALSRILACYADGDTPPALTELQSLIRDQDLASLRTGLPAIWNGLLGYHQKRGIRPNTQVTHAFNTIHGLVQE